MEKNQSTKEALIEQYITKGGMVYFDTSAKVLILERVWGLSPERSEGTWTITRAYLSHVYRTIFFDKGGVKAIFEIYRMCKIAIYAIIYLSKNNFNKNPHMIQVAATPESNKKALQPRMVNFIHTQITFFRSFTNTFLGKVYTSRIQLFALVGFNQENFILI